MFESLTLLAAAPPEGGNLVTNITTQFGVNWGLFTSQLIAFLIVAWALNKFAYKPVVEVLEKRKQAIADGLDNAEKQKQALAKAEESCKEILEKANADAANMISEAREAAAALRESESQKAIAEAKGIIDKAREANSAELERMKAELRGETVRLVAEVTAKVTGKVLNDDDQKRLAEETNNQLAA